MLKRSIPRVTHEKDSRWGARSFLEGACRCTWVASVESYSKIWAASWKCVYGCFGVVDCRVEKKKTPNCEEEDDKKMNEEEEEETVTVAFECSLATSMESTDSDYELALKLQFDDLPPEFTQEPFLIHEVLHSLFPHASLHPQHSVFASNPLQQEPQLVAGDAGAPRPAPSIHFTDVHRTEAVHIDQASCSSAVVTTLSLGLNTHLDDHGMSVSERPFQVFFKGVAATLDSCFSSAVEAVIVAPSGEVVHEIRPSVRPELSGRLIADYRALRNALAAALESKILHIQAVGDSKVLQDQMNGAAKISSVRVMELAREVMHQINQLEIFELLILPRIDNTTAWDMATRALIPGFSAAGEEKSTPNSRNKTPIAGLELPERCSICLDDKAQGEMMGMGGCSHRYCVRCVGQHAEAELREGQAPRCPEPECRREMTMEQCGGVLTKEQCEAVSRLWAEAAIPESERLYCPYADCSELFQKGFEPDEIVGVTETTCLSCRRSFCMVCGVPSHVPLSCSQYQELPLEERQEDDMKLYQLAATSNWKRCSHCRRIIQRNEGCAHMTCRCGYEFCYLCEARWRTCNC